MRGARLHIWTKFSEDWLKTATCISENVTISFKHEYRRPTLMSRCDVISDVINIKITFSGIISDDLSISDVKMNLSKIFRNFQNGRHFEVRAIFQTGSCTETWVLHQDRPYLSLSYELLFDDSSLKIDGVMAIFKIWPTFWPRDLVIWPLTYKKYTPVLDQATYVDQVSC